MSLRRQRTWTGCKKYAHTDTKAESATHTQVAFELEDAHGKQWLAKLDSLPHVRAGDEVAFQKLLRVAGRHLDDSVEVCRLSQVREGEEEEEYDEDFEDADKEIIRDSHSWVTLLSEYHRALPSVQSDRMKTILSSAFQDFTSGGAAATQRMGARQLYELSCNGDNHERFDHDILTALLKALLNRDLNILVSASGAICHLWESYARFFGRKLPQLISHLVHAAHWCPVQRPQAFSLSAAAKPDLKGKAASSLSRIQKPKAVGGIRDVSGVAKALKVGKKAAFSLNDDSEWMRIQLVRNCLCALCQFVHCPTSRSAVMQSDSVLELLLENAADVVFAAEALAFFGPRSMTSPPPSQTARSNGSGASGGVEALVLRGGVEVHALMLSAASESTRLSAAAMLSALAQDTGSPATGGSGSKIGTACYLGRAEICAVLGVILIDGYHSANTSAQTQQRKIKEKEAAAEAAAQDCETKPSHDFVAIARETPTAECKEAEDAVENEDFHASREYSFLVLSHLLVALHGAAHAVWSAQSSQRWPHGALQVDIKRAHGLLLSEDGLDVVDPYCKVTLASELVGETAVQFNSGDPTFDQSFLLPLPPQLQLLDAITEDTIQAIHGRDHDEQAEVEAGGAKGRKKPTKKVTGSGSTFELLLQQPHLTYAQATELMRAYDLGIIMMDKDFVREEEFLGEVRWTGAQLEHICQHNKIMDAVEALHRREKLEEEALEEVVQMQKEQLLVQGNKANEQFLMGMVGGALDAFDDVVGEGNGDEVNALQLAKNAAGGLGPRGQSDLAKQRPAMSSLQGPTAVSAGPLLAQSLALQPRQLAPGQPANEDVRGTLDVRLSVYTGAEAGFTFELLSLLVSMLPVESERTDLAYRKQQARLQLQARQQQKTQKQNTHQPPIRGQRWRPPVMSSGKKATGASSKAKVATTTAARTGAKGQGAGIASGGGSNSTSPVEKLVHSNGRVLLPKAVHVHSACIVACLARSSLASRIHECPGTLRRLEELTRHSCPLLSSLAFDIIIGVLQNVFDADRDGKIELAEVRRAKVQLTTKVPSAESRALRRFVLAICNGPVFDNCLNVLGCTGPEHLRPGYVPPQTAEQQSRSGSCASNASGAAGEGEEEGEDTVSSAGSEVGSGVRENGTGEAASDGADVGNRSGGSDSSRSRVPSKSAKGGCGGNISHTNSSGGRLLTEASAVLMLLTTIRTDVSVTQMQQALVLFKANNVALLSYATLTLWGLCHSPANRTLATEIGAVDLLIGWIGVFSVYIADRRAGAQIANFVHHQLKLLTLAELVEKLEALLGCVWLLSHSEAAAARLGHGKVPSFKSGEVRGRIVSGKGNGGLQLLHDLLKAYPPPGKSISVQADVETNTNKPASQRSASNADGSSDGGKTIELDGAHFSRAKEAAICSIWSACSDEYDTADDDASGASTRRPASALHTRIQRRPASGKQRNSGDMSFGGGSGYGTADECTCNSVLLVRRGILLELQRIGCELGHSSRLRALALRLHTFLGIHPRVRADPQCRERLAEADSLSRELSLEFALLLLLSYSDSPGLSARSGEPHDANAPVESPFLPEWFPAPEEGEDGHGVIDAEGMDGEGVNRRADGVARPHEYEFTTCMPVATMELGARVLAKISERQRKKESIIAAGGAHILCRKLRLALRQLLGLRRRAQLLGVPLGAVLQWAYDCNDQIYGPDPEMDDEHVKGARAGPKESVNDLATMQRARAVAAAALRPRWEGIHRQKLRQQQEFELQQQQQRGAKKGSNAGVAGKDRAPSKKQAGSAARASAVPTMRRLAEEHDEELEEATVLFFSYQQWELLTRRLLHTLLNLSAWRGAQVLIVRLGVKPITCLARLDDSKNPYAEAFCRGMLHNCLRHATNRSLAYRCELSLKAGDAWEQMFEPDVALEGNQGGDDAIGSNQLEDAEEADDSDTEELARAAKRRERHGGGRLDSDENELLRLGALSPRELFEAWCKSNVEQVDPGAEEGPEAEREPTSAAEASAQAIKAQDQTSAKLTRGERLTAAGAGLASGINLPAPLFAPSCPGDQRVMARRTVYARMRERQSAEQRRLAAEATAAAAQLAAEREDRRYVGRERPKSAHPASTSGAKKKGARTTVTRARPVSAKVANVDAIGWRATAVAVAADAASKRKAELEPIPHTVSFAKPASLRAIASASSGGRSDKSSRGAAPSADATRGFSTTVGSSMRTTVGSSMMSRSSMRTRPRTASATMSRNGSGMSMDMTNPDFDPDEGIKFINPDGTTTTMGRSMIARDDFISSLGATSTSGWSQESRADGKQGSSGVISSELRGIVRPRTAPAVRLSNLVEQTDIDNRLRDVVDKKMKASAASAFVKGCVPQGAERRRRAQLLQQREKKLQAKKRKQIRKGQSKSSNQRQGGVRKKHIGSRPASGRSEGRSEGEKPNVKAVKEVSLYVRLKQERQQQKELGLVPATDPWHPDARVLRLARHQQRNRREEALGSVAKNVSSKFSFSLDGNDIGGVLRGNEISTEPMLVTWRHRKGARTIPLLSEEVDEAMDQEAKDRREEERENHRREEATDHENKSSKEEVKSTEMSAVKEEGGGEVEQNEGVYVYCKTVLAERIEVLLIDRLPPPPLNFFTMLPSLPDPPDSDPRKNKALVPHSPKFKAEQHRRAPEMPRIGAKQLPGPAWGVLDQVPLKVDAHTLARMSPPVFNPPPGSKVDYGTKLSIKSSRGGTGVEVYFTTDCSDPHPVDGGGGGRALSASLLDGPLSGRPGECFVFDTPGIVCIKAVSTKEEWQDSVQVVAKYKVRAPPLPPWNLRKSVFAPRRNQYESHDYYDGSKTAPRCLDKDWKHIIGKKTFRVNFLEKEASIGLGEDGGNNSGAAEKERLLVKEALAKVYPVLLNCFKVYAAGIGMSSGNGFCMKINKWNEFCEDCRFELWEPPAATPSSNKRGLSGSDDVVKTRARRDSQFTESVFDEIFMMSNLTEAGGSGDKALGRPEFMECIMRLAHTKARYSPSLHCYTLTTCIRTSFVFELTYYSVPSSS
jgi:hypothetical protein